MASAKIRREGGIELVNLLRYAVPLVLASTGETVGQKSGVINIGLEGCLMVGAYAAMAITIDTKNPFLGCAAGIIAGLLLALLFAWFTVWRSQDQVVVGTAINLLATGLTLALFQSRFGQSGSLLSLPSLPQFASKWDLVMLLVPLLVILAWGTICKTTWGLALRAAGEAPKAVEAAGFSALKLRTHGLAVSGALGGLAGAYLTVGLTGSYAPGITAGRGFVAIAMVTFGRWRPFWVAMATLLVGFADSLQYELQAAGLPVPYQLLKALPYLIALTVLIIVGSGRDVPQSLGQPFRRNS
jgi:simple sugar transport system permease protein